ncbi:MAG: hypothetical protein Q9182_006628 [Xanthomendoza sp. 2 TL-2023]
MARIYTSLALANLFSFLFLSSTSSIQNFLRLLVYIALLKQSYPSLFHRLTPLQLAVLNAFHAACDLLPRNLRRSLVLIGGAATIAHGMVSRKTKDADIVTSVAALAILDNCINNRQGGFHKDSDGAIMWEQRDPVDGQSFFVTVEFLQIGGPFLPRLPEVIGFGEGCVATLPELVRLRCETVVARGDDGDDNDLRLLLKAAKKKEVQLPHIDEEEMRVMVEAVSSLGDDTLGGDFVAILSSFDWGGRRWGPAVGGVFVFP